MVVPGQQPCLDDEHNLASSAFVVTVNDVDVFVAVDVDVIVGVDCGFVRGQFEPAESFFKMLVSGQHP